VPGECHAHHLERFSSTTTRAACNHDFEVWLEKLAPEENPTASIGTIGGEDNAERAISSAPSWGREVVVGHHRRSARFSGRGSRFSTVSSMANGRKRALIKIIGE